MKTPTQNGFTLIEMAAVLMIVGLLLGGLLVPLSAQMEQRNVSETRKYMDEVRDALLGFVIANGRFPSPACGTIATGQTNAGIELSAASAPLCTTSANDISVLPWATLGVSETDAWGRRLTYRVTSTFADTTDGANGTCAVTSGVSFQLCSTGNITVKDSSAGTNVASNIPAIVISHGAKGCGAYLPTGGRMQDDPAVALPNYCNDANQQENVDGNATFVSKTPTSSFDDIVVWITPNILLNRMVTAGKLP